MLTSISFMFWPLYCTCMFWLLYWIGSMFRLYILVIYVDICYIVTSLCFEMYWLYDLSQHSYPISSIFWIALVIRFVTALLPYQLYVLNCIGYTFCHRTLTVSALCFELHWLYVTLTVLAVCFELYWLYVLSQHSYRISSMFWIVLAIRFVIALLPY